MQVQLVGNWLDASDVDAAVGRAGHSFVADAEGTVITIPVGCNLLIDGAIRLLAYANQFSGRGIAIQLVFQDGLAGTMGYLDRMGFFDQLAPGVEVWPDRPAVSGAVVYQGWNDGLVEIGAINEEGDRYALLDKLVDALRTTCGGRPDFDSFEAAMATILSELVDNVYEHGGTGVTGYAALQRYPRSNTVRVVVSDDGHGLMETIRPALEARDKRYRAVEDVELLVEMFRDGLSRLDDAKRGNGLKGCAARAIQFKAKLEVRLKTQNVLLVPSGTSYVPNKAYMSTNLAEMAGTHLSFIFSLV
jgi:hypothetical protein